MTEERTMLLGLARVQLEQEPETTGQRRMKVEMKSRKSSTCLTWWEGQWVQSSEEEELSAVVAQGQKGMRV